MISQVLANFDMTWLTALGFFLFAGLFIGVVVWTFRKGSKKTYNHNGNIPFDEGAKK